jgi:hypothetical protein
LKEIDKGTTDGADVDGEAQRRRVEVTNVALTAEVEKKQPAEAARAAGKLKPMRDTTEPPATKPTDGTTWSRAKAE